MDNTLYQIIEHLKIGLVISYTLLCITLKLLLDLFKAVLFVIISLINFISSIGGLLIPIIAFITSIEEIFNGEHITSQLCIKAPQPIHKEKYLTITNAD